MFSLWVVEVFKKMIEEKFLIWVGGRLLYLKKDLSVYINIYIYLWVIVIFFLALFYRIYKLLLFNDLL